MSLKLKPLADQVMVITGASSGIGLVTARAAAARGARVLLVARNAAALAEAAEGIVAAGGTADFHAADVGDAGAVEAAAAKAVALWGRIDTWVNDAGTAIYAKLVDTPLVEHEQLFRTNYFGVVHGATAALPRLRERGGALITVASIASDLPSPILGAYAASKHAVKAYLEALRMELGAEGAPISVTIIKPSGIDTPIAQHAANHMPGEALIPAPVYDPQVVADAILDAAEHPRRDVTVGGAGRAQVLAGTHFPWLIDALTGLLEKATYDPSRAKTAETTIAAPGDAGRERSGVQPGFRHSLYTSAVRHRGLVLGIGVAAGALAGAIALARRRA